MHRTRAHQQLLAAAGVFAATCGICGPASAQSTADKALAEQLFRTGQELMKQQRYADACLKLAESQRLDPGTGTLLNLAVCHEHEGKLASAWSELNEVATLARRDQRPDRVQYAEQRAAALEPKLSRLVIALEPGADTPGLEIRLDGALLGRAVLDVPAPVDPGPHVISARAPGKRPWQIELEIAATAEQKTARVPKLLDAPVDVPPPAGASVPPSDSRTGNTQRIGAYLLGGVGIAAVGMGGFFGLRAISKNQASKDEGCNGNQCPAEAAETRRAALSAGNVSTLAFIVGGAALAGGVTLYLTAPRARRDEKPRATLALVPGLSTLRVEGQW